VRRESIYFKKSETKRMKGFLVILAAIAMSSCAYVKDISIHADGSASVTQDYTFYQNRKKWDSKGPFNKEKELLEYQSPIITDIKDSVEVLFSFRIESVDSLSNYLSGLPKGFVNIRLLGDSLCIVETQKLEHKPNTFGSYVYIYLNFESDILNVAKSPRTNLYWKKKSFPKRVSFRVYPKKLWRRQRTLLIAIELKGSTLQQTPN
jgi:hypothetical protein